MLRQVGVAFLDAAARRLGACEFADDEHFCSLEAVLLQLGAKEVVLPKARPHAKALPQHLGGQDSTSASFRPSAAELAHRCTGRGAPISWYARACVQHPQPAALEHGGGTPGSCNDGHKASAVSQAPRWVCVPGM